MILINALGCLETGARQVAIQLTNAFPPTQKALLIVANTKDDFEPPSNVKVIALNHTLFGRFLRPLTEVLINLLLFLPIFDRYINLSHYGLCLFGKHRVYMHSLEMIHDNPARGFARGKMNPIKEYYFNTCLKHAEKFYVQAEHVKLILSQKSAKKRNGSSLPILKMRPDWNISLPSKGEAKIFGFQFFYPTSPFVHKRPDLAVAAIEEVSRAYNNVGLIITVPQASNNEYISYLGQTTHQRVLSILIESDALLFTSEKETLGLPILEAMKAGIPIIAPRLPYAEELLGEAGLYFKSGDKNDLCRAIKQMLVEKKEWVNKVKIRDKFLAKDSWSWEDQWSALLE